MEVVAWFLAQVRSFWKDTPLIDGWTCSWGQDTYFAVHYATILLRDIESICIYGRCEEPRQTVNPTKPGRKEAIDKLSARQSRYGNFERANKRFCASLRASRLILARVKGWPASGRICVWFTPRRKAADTLRRGEGIKRARCSIPSLRFLKKGCFFIGQARPLAENKARSSHDTAIHLHPMPRRRFNTSFVRVFNGIDSGSRRSCFFPSK